jgi:hypothetical protein
VRRFDLYAFTGLCLGLATLTASLAWGRFQWAACRADPNHSIWFCIQHLGGG